MMCREVDEGRLLMSLRLTKVKGNTLSIIGGEGLSGDGRLKGRDNNW